MDSSVPVGTGVRLVFLTSRSGPVSSCLGPKLSGTPGKEESFIRRVLVEQSV